MFGPSKFKLFGDDTKVYILIELTDLDTLANL